MIKFVVILTTTLTLNFTVAFGEYPGLPEQKEKSQEIQLVFSEQPIGFESGQPVYPVSTNVVVKTPQKGKLMITVDGGKPIEKKSTSEVDISKHLKGKAGTHTVMVEMIDKDSNSVQKIFGFTTK